VFVHLKTQGIMRIDAVHKRQAPIPMGELVDFA
jgi:hypothetical protein